MALRLLLKLFMMVFFIINNNNKTQYYLLHLSAESVNLSHIYVYGIDIKERAQI